MHDPCAPSPRPLLILKTGDSYASLRDARGDFENWVAEGLDASDLPVLVLDPRAGDALPAVTDIAGVVVTGSHAMVSHREAWSERAAAWLARVVESGDVPVLGICYGHQLLAHALGGEAGDHPVATEIGTVQVRTTEAAAHDPLFAAMPPRFHAHVVHRQSALKLPPGAVRLAGNEHEPNQAFRVGEQTWGVQFHPEFDEAVMRGYIDELSPSLPDARTLAQGVRATPEAAQLLRRFAQIVLAAQPADALAA